MVIFSVNPRIQSECEKLRARKTNLNTSQAVLGERKVLFVYLQSQAKNTYQTKLLNQANLEQKTITTFAQLLTATLKFYF